MPPTDTDPDVGKILGYLYSSGLSLYDLPEYYAVLADFPLTASGKVLKRELVKQIDRGDFTPLPIRFSASEDRTRP